MALLALLKQSVRLHAARMRLVPLDTSLESRVARLTTAIFMLMVELVRLALTRSRFTDEV
ncbi:MAG TPA: hypothetical protein VFF73_42020 [Planctomycetota bacterium]|nr:hypothetical protein [Planctomycetota bacterium]